MQIFESVLINVTALISHHAVIQPAIVDSTLKRFVWTSSRPVTVCCPPSYNANRSQTLTQDRKWKTTISRQHLHHARHCRSMSLHHRIQTGATASSRGLQPYSNWPAQPGTLCDRRTDRDATDRRTTGMDQCLDEVAKYSSASYPEIATRMNWCPCSKSLAGYTRYWQLLDQLKLTYQLDDEFRAAFVDSTTNKNLFEWLWKEGMKTNNFWMVTLNLRQ